MMMNNTHSTRKTLIKRLLIRFVAIVIIGVCCTLPFVIAWYGEDIEDWFAVRETSRGLPAAEIRFNTMVKQITDILGDTALNERISPLGVPSQSYTHCIRGGVTWYYGTDRSYEDVIEEYVEAFTQTGWEHQPFQQDNHHLFLSKTGKITITLVPSPSEYHSNNNPVVFRIRLNYAEPSIRECSGTG
jgi:hypothetical protein